MQLKFDPGQGQSFWQEISYLPGYPSDEEMPISVMVFETDAIYRLGEVLLHIEADPTLPVLVVMDQTPMQRNSDSLKPLFLQILHDQGWQVEIEMMQPDATSQVHTDMAHIDIVKRRLKAGQSVIALGSGTICDITKHACFIFAQETGQQLPFLVFQTANSVSAFTSNMAPTFIDGVKRTLPSRYPDALICDLETLRDAPVEMTIAGVGDLLAAFVSFPDWYLANQLGLDPDYSDLPQTLLGPLDEIFISQAEAIRTRSLDGMALLAKLIALGGLAMSLSHATTPMSGYEHVMSHILDLQSEISSRPLAAHGSQVALTSILGTGAYQRFLAEFEAGKIEPGICYPSASPMEILLRDSFSRLDPSGKAGEECWADYRLKLDAWHAHRPDFESFLNDWPDIKGKLLALTAPPERLKAILEAIQAPISLAKLVPPIQLEEAKLAFINAPLMRKRFTLGDLLVFLQWDREKLWEQIYGLVI